jgi:hypothetical protein
LPAPTALAPSLASTAPIDPSRINEHSLEMIQAVKTALNLSSDVEALNMMVAIAYKNLKNLLA